MRKHSCHFTRRDRLLATAIAQLLTMHPDFRAGQARRRARKLVGAKPAKKLLIKRGETGLKQELEKVAVAAAGGAALKVASKLGRKVSEKPEETVDARSGNGAHS